MNIFCKHPLVIILYFHLNILVYNVAGLCSYDLFDEINFEEWFAQGLVKELQNKSPKYVECFFVNCNLQFATLI